MKYVWYAIVLTSLTVAVTTCGTDMETANFRTKPQSTHTIDTENIDWKVVGTVNIRFSQKEASLGLTPVSTNITYTEPEKGIFSLKSGTIVASMTDDTLSLGNLEIDTIRVNKLKVCGVGGTEKCTVAAIRVYTTGSIEGFRNTTDGSYGLPVTVEGHPVLLTQTNAVNVETYTIPANDRRLRNNDFSDLIYPISVDFSNGGDGNYEMDLVIELVLGS